MPKYTIKQFETVVNSYEVEADNLTEALISLSRGEGDFMGIHDSEPEANDHIGISFDELPDDIDLDIERIRTEFNSERRSEYIESIHSFDIPKELVYLCNSCHEIHEDPTESCDHCPSESIRIVSKGDLQL